MSTIRFVVLLASISVGLSCFGTAAPQRSYYVLHGVAVSLRDTAPIEGMVRVRNMDSDSIYEKFQIVVRRSPFELNYSETNVWAVKPNRMVSDVIARALGHSRRFTAVSRELGEIRPDYTLSGTLHAIEVYDSGDLWYGHIALTLSLSRFDSGQTLLTFNFDERKPVPARTFSVAARAISELLSTALDEFIARLADVDVARAPMDPPPPPPVKSAPDDDHDSPEPLYVPEHERTSVPDRGNQRSSGSTTPHG